MKSNNIFLAIAFFLLTFVACTEEKEIDGPGSLGKGDIMLNMASSINITKAGNADEEHGYTYATDEELTIGNCWVFVVAGENIIKSTYFSKPQEISNETYEGKYTKGYSVTISDLDYSKSGQKYVFGVIANPTEENYSIYEECTTLEQLKAVIEGEKNPETASYSNVFADPTKLVKVGFSEPISFDRQTTTVQVGMTQLAARVSLTFDVKLERKYKGESYEYYFKGETIGNNGILDYKALKKVNPDAANNTGTDLTEEKVKSYKYGNFNLTFGKSGKSKGFKVDKMEVKRITQYYGYALSDLNISINGIRLNAQIGEPLNLNYTNPAPIYKEKTINGINTITYICTFYTYGTKELNITLAGNILYGDFYYEQEGFSSGYIINDADGKNCKALKAGTAASPLDFSNGWQGNIEKFEGVLISNKEDLELNGEVKSISGGNQVEKPYNPSSFLLKPKNGFRDGFYYDGIINITTVPINGVLSVEIESIKEHEVSFDFN